MRKFILLLLGCISQNALSGGIDVDEILLANWAAVATISAGPAWQNGGETQTFFLAPELQKTYTSNNSMNTLADVELFLGAQYSLEDLWQGQLGLAGVTTSKTKIAGNIWDDADAEFNNFTYHYHIRHTHLALKGKILREVGYNLVPWISGSIGIAWNQASQFNNTPRIFEAVANPNFADNTNTAFTYTLGAGVQYWLAQHWQIGIGYEFADWGKSHLGRALNQTVGNGLRLNHLYTNGFMLNISFISA